MSRSQVGGAGSRGEEETCGCGKQGAKPGNPACERDCSQATGSPARLARPMLLCRVLTRDGNIPATRRPKRLFPSVTDPSCRAAGLCRLGTAWKLGINSKRGNNSMYKCLSVTLDRVHGVCVQPGMAMTLSARRRPYGLLQRGKSTVGSEHKFSRPGPIAADALFCALTGPIARRSVPLIINNLPMAPDVGNAKKASELPAPACGALAQAV